MEKATINSRENRATIKVFLLNECLTAVWLINELAKRGVNTDSSTFSSTLKGCRKGPLADKIIETSLLIKEHYEKNYKAD